MEWTDERVDRLKQMHADGLSCSIIAHRLGGVTRSAVIGKIHRLGLANGTMPRTRMAIPGNRLRGAQRKRAAPYVKRAAPHPFVGAYQPTPDLEIPPHERKTLLELEEHCCRWPYGSGTPSDPYYFCGKVRVGGQSYCDFHVRRAVGAPQPHRSNPIADTPALAEAVPA